MFHRDSGRDGRTVGGTLLATIVAVVVGTGDARAEPKVVVAWPVGPLEARLAFDSPIDEARAKSLVGSLIRLVEEGSGVSGQPVGASPSRGIVRIAAVGRIDGGRTIRLFTDPHARVGEYELGLPEGVAPVGPIAKASEPRARSVRRYDLYGVEASVDDGTEGATPSTMIWLPELDLDASRSLTKGSAGHEAAFAEFAKPGRLTLSTLVAFPQGRVSVRLSANGPIGAVVGGEEAQTNGGNVATSTVESTGDPVDLTVTVRTGAGAPPPTLKVTYQVEKDAKERPLERSRQLVPWAPAPPARETAAAPPPFVLTGGNPARGEAAFFSDKAKCSQCHKVGGRGGIVGPDLGEMRGRRLPEIYRALADPSATIHPNYVAYTVAAKDGRVVVGIVRSEGAETLLVTDTDAKSTSIKRADVEELRPSSTSIMPVGLAGVLGEEGVRDVLAFLAGAGASNAIPPAP